MKPEASPSHSEKNRLIEEGGRRNKKKKGRDMESSHALSSRTLKMKERDIYMLRVESVIYIWDGAG